MLAQSQGNDNRGKVYLVGAGPGDPGLLTVKAKALLEQAEVVIYDALISPEILSLIPPSATVIYGGKRQGQHSLHQDEIIRLLIQEAQTGRVVIRLKGGDPFIFGRGGEEAQALLSLGIPVEVVPGVTAGIAVPAYAGIPLTHRDYSSSVVFVTGHERAGKYEPQVRWRSLAQTAETLVIYMGVHNLPFIVAELQAGGRDPQTPIALIRWGTCPQQAELVGTLGTIVDQQAAANFTAPALAIVGAVVSLYSPLRPVSPLPLDQVQTVQPQAPN